MISRSTRGFSLIEVMVSMGVLTVGILATLPLLTFSVDRQTQARKVTGAQYLGNTVLDRLRMTYRYAAVPMADWGSLTYTNDTAWRAELLPYAASDSATGSAGPVTDCQPAANVTDGYTYGIGPFAMRYEGNDYWMCYAFAAPPGGYPPNAQSVVIKVLWRQANNSFGARYVSGVLFLGR